MSDERINFRPLRQLNSHKLRAGFFTRRVKGCGIEVAANAGSAEDVARLIAHTRRELEKREAEKRKVEPQTDF
jgi:hypothetical protein